MQRIIATLIAISLLSFTSLAHGDDSHFAKKQDVTVKTTKVSGNVYMLQGRGGNIGAINGPDGILIVDDDYKTVSKALSDALKELGSATPRFIFNTHWHQDHTEGNDFFGKTSIIMAHNNVRKRMLDPPMIFGRKAEPYVSHALPIVTYDKSMTMHLNGEEILGVHYPNGHTDGDTVVFFKKANVVHLGDDFFVGRFPFVDVDSGGSVNGLIHNIMTLITVIPPDAKLIPGHGPLSTVDDLKAYLRLITESSQIVTDAMKAGKTLDEIKKTGLPERFKDAGTGFIKTDMWIEIVHRSASKR